MLNLFEIIFYDIRKDGALCVEIVYIFTFIVINIFPMFNNQIITHFRVQSFEFLHFLLI